MGVVSTAATAQTEQHSVKAATDYIVLTQEVATTASITGGQTETINHGKVWSQVGTVSAKSAEAAVKKFAEQHRPKEGEKLTLVAVAAARWSPVTVSERVTRTLEIS